MNDILFYVAFSEINISEDVNSSKNISDKHIRYSNKLYYISHMKDKSFILVSISVKTYRLKCVQNVSHQALA